MVNSSLFAEDAPKSLSPKKLHIYLLIGQSNMAGRAPLSDDLSGVIDRCYLLNGQDEWEPARNPLNRYSTIRKNLGMQRLGPGYSFVRAMLEQDASMQIGVIVNARGGSSIREWAKGSKAYNDAIMRTIKAREDGVLKGVLWHQGESDAHDEAYMEKLAALIADLRTDLGDPNLPFVAGQLLYDTETRPHTRPINELLAGLPAAMPFTGCVLSDGLTSFDNLHFDTRSALILGQRYAEEMKRIHLTGKRFLGGCR